MTVVRDARLGEVKHVSTPWALRRYRTLAEWEDVLTVGLLAGLALKDAVYCSVKKM